MADGIATAEVGLRLAAQKAPAANTIDAMLYEAANKSLSEGNAAEAAKKIKNPGTSATTDEINKRVDQIFKKDNVDGSGNPDQTREQKSRQDTVSDLSNAILELRTNGYSALNPAEKKLISTSLIRSIYNHPTIREIARSKKIDLTSSNFKLFCIDTANELLSSQRNGENIANGLVDLLEGANINYEGLLTELESKKDLDKVIDELGKEVGDDGATSGTKTGLHEEIDKQKTIAKGYQTEIKDVNGTPTVVAEAGTGSRAEMKLNAEARQLDYEKTIGLYESSISQTASFFSIKIQQADTETSILDPSNPGGGPITIRKSEWPAKKTEWDNKVKDLKRNQTKDQQLITKIDQEEIEAKAKLTELEGKLKAKKTELDTKKKELTNIDKKIAKARDINEKGTVANLEQELIKDLENLIVSESLDLWFKGEEAAGKVEGDVVKTIEEEMAQEAKKRLRTLVYNEQKRKFETKKLDAELNTLIAGGVEGYGVGRMQLLWTACNEVSAAPELKKFIPVLKGIADFTTDPPKIINKEKLAAFSSAVTADILKMVAYKDPKALENKFSKDERAMAALRGDILPTLIESAMSDSSLRSVVEKSLGTKATMSSIREALNGANWAKIFKWLLLALGIVAGGFTLITLLQHG